MPLRGQRSRVKVPPRWVIGFLAIVVSAGLVWLLQLRSGAAGEDERIAEAVEDATERAGAGAGPAAPDFGREAAAEEGIDAADREVFARTIRRALAERLDTLPIGARVAALGRWFVGAPYTPGTLELRPERLVVNLREFDCVTYVEAMIAVARVLDGDPTFDRFLEELRRIRYRDGRIEGYASRLHYFSEWIRDNEEKGIVRDVTRELGGIRVDEPVNFMSSNREAYDALEDPETLARIARIEARLSELPRYYIPQDRIAKAAPGIRDGDVIAITSAIEGLDIAHTGFAIWIDGRLHFMNAPLIGTEVRISERPLAERVARIEGQDGIMVARPVQRSAARSSS